jgi:hypothetical protein
MAPAAAYLNRGQAAPADASRAHWKAAGWPDADPIRKMAEAARPPSRPRRGAWSGTSCQGARLSGQLG